MDLKKVGISIMIQLYTTERRLCKLRYEYKDVHKDMFIVRYK